MSEMHLRKPGFPYRACKLFRKIKKRIQTAKETGDTWYIYQNDVEKSSFHHDKERILNILKVFPSY